MAFFSSTVQPASNPVAEKPVNNAAGAALLTTLLLSVYAAQKSKKAMRKMKRRFVWTAFKLKLKSLFSKNREVSDRTLLLILLAVIVLALLLINVVVGLIVLLFILLLYLLGVFKI
jgi:hypothetical protein